MKRSLLAAFAAVLMTTIGAPGKSQVGEGPGGGPLLTGKLLAASQLAETMPYALWNGMIVVRAVVADGQPLTAVLNTGLPICTIAPQVAVKAGVRAGGGLRDIRYLYGSVKMLAAAPVALHLGNATLHDVPICVYDLMRALTTKSITDAPAVWLGTSALAAFSVTIDPRKNELQFHASNAPLPAKAVVVPFEIRDGRIWVNVQVNGRKQFEAVVDTGSVGTLLPESLGRELSLPAGATYPVTHPAGGNAKVAAVQLNEIKIGDLTVPDVQALYVSSGTATGFDDGKGIIGNDVLLRYRVTIDYGQRKIAFEAYNIPIVPLSSGKPDAGKAPPAAGKGTPTTGPNKPASAGDAAPPAPTMAPGGKPPDGAKPAA